MDFLAKLIKNNLTILSLGFIILLGLASAYIFTKSAQAAFTLSSTGTISNPTKNSIQPKLIFDGTRWWAFYLKSTSPHGLFYAYSSDLQNWTEIGTAISNGESTDGGDLSVVYSSSLNIVVVGYISPGSGGFWRYLRGTISGTTISWSNPGNSLIYSNGYALYSGDHNMSLAINSNNKLLFIVDDSNGNAMVDISATTLSSSFNVDETDFSAVGTPAQNSGVPFSKAKVLPLASGNIVTLINDQWTSGTTRYGVRYSRWNGSTWSNFATLIDGSVTGDWTNWGTIQLGNYDIYTLGQSSANSFGFAKYTGSVVSLNAPSWPTGGLVTNSQVSLVTDGTDIWAFVIRGDANKTVSYNKYTVSSDSWGGWIDITTSAATRTFVVASQNVGNNTIGVMWTEDAGGGNYNIMIAPVSTTVSGIPHVQIRGGVISGSSQGAITRTGSVGVIQNATNSGNSNINVPADATLIVVGVEGYVNSLNYFGSGTLTLGGQPLTLVRADRDNVADSDKSSVWYIASNSLPTGTQSLVWDWGGSSNFADGGQIIYAFYKGVDLSNPVKDSGGNYVESYFGNSITISTASMSASAGDIVWSIAYLFNQTSLPTGETWGGASTIYEANYNTSRGAAAEGFPSGNIVSSLTPVGGSGNNLWMTLSSVVFRAGTVSSANANVEIRGGGVEGSVKFR